MLGHRKQGEGRHARGPIERKNSIRIVRPAPQACRAARWHVAAPVWRILVPLVLLGAVAAATAQEAMQPPPSLKKVPVWRPKIIANFVKDKAASIRLGKALFWDMQVSSDGVIACASCHMHAGADGRPRNQLAPGRSAGDGVFGNNAITGVIDYPRFGPNAMVKAEDFPFHHLADRHDRNSELLRDTNDVMGSMGVFYSKFLAIRLRSAVEKTAPLNEPAADRSRGLNVRRKNARHTPTIINAAYNWSQNADGRASHFFNGSSQWGPLDDKAAILVNDNAGLRTQKIRIPGSSIASQAMAPPTDEFEMSAAGRTWPDIGKKMLTLLPLGKQLVHPYDSVLGRWSRARLAGGQVTGNVGLRTDYAAMIRDAFHAKFWDSDKAVRYADGQPVFFDRPARPLGLGEYTQMEANFSLFAGLAIQDYLMTLVSNDSPYDRWQDDPQANPLTMMQMRGLEVFMNVRKCGACHSGSEFTNAGLSTIAANAGLTPSTVQPPACGCGYNCPCGCQTGLDCTCDPGVCECGCECGPDCACGCEWGFPCRCAGEGVTNYLQIMNGTLKMQQMVQGTALVDLGWLNTGVRPVAEDIGIGMAAPFTNPLTGQPYPVSQARLAVLKKKGLLPPEVADFVPDLPAGVDETVFVAVDGAMKTSTLRNVDLTGPYFHNGGQATIMQCFAFYMRGGDFQEDPRLAHVLMQPGVPVPADGMALTEFILALTDDRVRQAKAPFDHPQLFIPMGLKTDMQGNVIGRFDRVNRLGFRECEDVMELKPVGAGGRPAAGMPPLMRFLNLPPNQH